MITFDLSCENDHRFEGWFRDRDDFEDQKERGLISCPLCGSSEILKRLSPVAVHVGRRTAAPARRAPASAEGEAESPSPQEQVPGPGAFFRALAQFVETHFEDVGASFAQEARKIEEGEGPARNIRGTTTSEEEESLREDGIEFLKIALPKYDA
jgi:hypothetical protein